MSARTKARKPARAVAKPVVLDPADPIAIARTFIAARYPDADGHGLRFWWGKFFHWTTNQDFYGNYWQEYDVDALRREVFDFLESAKTQHWQRAIDKYIFEPFAPSLKQVGEVVAALKVIAYAKPIGKRLHDDGTVS